MIRGIALVVTGIWCAACVAGPPRASATPRRVTSALPETIALHYDRHLPSLPVRIDGELDARFVFDTGIGINLVSKSLCKMLACRSAGQFTGERMSGQEVTVPLARLRSLAVGHEEQRDVVVGLIDMDQLVGDSDVQGFLSLGFFAKRPFTLDETRSVLVLEDAASAEKRVAGGTAVSVTLRREGPSLTAFLPLEIAGERVLAEVDTGSDALILDERFMDALGVDRATAKALEGRDETDHPFKRWFTTLPAKVHPAGVPALGRGGLRTMFQKIIHDGLVGRTFFAPWAVTFDLAHERISFAPSPSRL